jgi:ATP-dependent Lhr-like helicase
VPHERLAAFLPGWQHVPAHGQRSTLRGLDGCFEVIDQLAGTALPASTWLRAVLPTRVDDAHDGLLDALIASGDVVWWGLSPLPGGDGVVALAPADRAADLRATPGAASGAAAVVLDTLRSAGAVFFRDLADAVGVGASDGVVPTDADLLEVLWDLVWAGQITNDGWAGLRARIGGARAGRSGPSRSRRRPGLLSRSGPPAGAGRWSALPVATIDATAQGVALGQVLLDRHGIVTRGAVAAERVEGGFARLHRVLTGFEDVGRCRRVYAVEGLGAAQFALPVAVDRLRAARSGREPEVVVLAATDPANAYGAALPWPASSLDSAHRPARKAGSVVVLADGRPVLYLERGGRSLITWTADDDICLRAARALVADAGRVGLDRAIVTRVDGAEPTPRLAGLLTQAGFRPTPRGLRLGGR